jgi:hypothetical protein
VDFPFSFCWEDPAVSFRSSPFLFKGVCDHAEEDCPDDEEDVISLSVQGQDDDNDEMFPSLNAGVDGVDDCGIEDGDACLPSLMSSRRRRWLVVIVALTLLTLLTLLLFLVRLNIFKKPMVK